MALQLYNMYMLYHDTLFLLAHRGCIGPHNNISGSPLISLRVVGIPTVDSLAFVSLSIDGIAMNRERSMARCERSIVDHCCTVTFGWYVRRVVCKTYFCERGVCVHGKEVADSLSICQQRGSASCVMVRRKRTL